MSERNYYVICDDNCKFEGMTKEQIYDAIAEATGTTPTPVDEAFITKIKEQNANHNLKMWKGTEAQYAALQTKDTDTVYIVGSANAPAKVTDTNQFELALDEINEDITQLQSVSVIKDEWVVSATDLANFKTLYSPSGTTGFVPNDTSHLDFMKSADVIKVVAESHSGKNVQPYNGIMIRGFETEFISGKTITNTTVSLGFGSKSDSIKPYRVESETYKAFMGSAVDALKFIFYKMP